MCVTISNFDSVFFNFLSQRGVFVFEMLWVEPDGLDFVTDSSPEARECMLFNHTITFVGSADNGDINVALFVHVIACCRAKYDNGHKRHFSNLESLLELVRQLHCIFFLHD